ncbi:MAG: hypothetical protein ACT4P3_05565 [Betaproteobacteria bacterium]
MPIRFDNREEPRRRLLLKALAAGLLGWAGPAWPQLFGRRPRLLGPAQPIYELSGRVSVNGRPATPQMRIGPGDTVETAAGSRVIFVVGTDAYLLRERSTVQIAAATAGVMRLVTGALLSVFGRGDEKRLRIPTATIGIRGTGLYLEADPERGYACNCYGDMVITAADDPAASERVVTRHHDAPRYALASGRRIRPAPFINHSDVELMLIETLVGRVTPFPLFDEEYGAARRRY